MSQNLLEKAYSHYLELLHFLLAGNGQEGIIQPFNLATSLSVSQTAERYNLFLLMNAVDYVAPTVTADTETTKKDCVHAKQLHDAYHTFIDELSTSLLKMYGKENDPTYLDLVSKLNTSQGELEGYRTFVMEKWNFYKQTHTIPQESEDAERKIFESDGGYSLELRRKKDKIKFLNVKINDFIKDNTPRDVWPLINAKAAFYDDNKKIRLPSSPILDKDSKKELWDDFQKQYPLIDLDEFLSKDDVRTKSFSTTTDVTEHHETSWHGGVNFSWGVFSGGGSATRKKCEDLSTSEHFSFEIHFDKFEEKEIFRGEWYQDSLFTTFGKDLKGFWGYNGLLAAIPYSLILARGTKVTVKMSAEYRDTITSHVDGGGSFKFGPFSIGGGASSDDSVMKYNKTEEGFTLSDNNKTIRILAARVRRFNWDNEKNDDLYESLSAINLNKAFKFYESVSEKNVAIQN